MAFTYHAVAKDHIRLLKVPDPSIQSQNERLEFTIDAVPLRSAPAYSAVSYVWGLGSASKEIHLNGCTFAVRTNLWSCLHYIRKYQKSPSAHCAWRYIWVDAICINPVNTEERNQQVQLMDRIFSQATEVSAWLGEDDSADMSCSLIPVIFIVQVVQQCRICLVRGTASSCCVTTSL